MGSFSPFWTDRTLYGPWFVDQGPPVRLDREELFLRLHFAIVFVRDQERNLRFYLDQLGFHLVGGITTSVPATAG